MGRGRPAAGKPARVAKLSSMSERTALPAVSADELELSPGWRAALEGYARELLPIRSALRRFGVVIRQLGETQAGQWRTDDASNPADS